MRWGDDQAQRDGMARYGLGMPRTREPVGEEVVAKPQLPRREKPIPDVVCREEIDRLEAVMVHERDKLIIRTFAAGLV
jgi:hypothetical protein